jgi:hypothetical protein
MNLRTPGLTVMLFVCLVAAACFPPPKGDSNDVTNVNQPPATPATTPAATTVKITYPDDKGMVEQGETVRGTSQNIPAGQKIWVVIFIPKVGRYYPQNNPATVQPDGNWNSLTSFGVPKDKGLKFDVLAVTTDGNAQNAFRDYLKDARDKSDFPGLEQLPAGATQQHNVTVTRK